MQRRYSLVHLILANVVVLSLTPLMVAIDAQARIAFMSDREGNSEIYVMDNHGAISEISLTILLMIGPPHGRPDGKRITFSSNRDGKPEIYVMDADGDNQRKPH